MAFKGPQVIKGQGNSGSGAPDKDRVCALVIGGQAATGLALNTPLRIVHPSQAEAVGINASYDANNGILAFDHIEEHFRLAPESELIIMLTARPTTDAGFTGLFAAAGPVDGLIRSQVGKDVKYIFMAFNPTSAVVPSFAANGLVDQVKACLDPAQALIDAHFDEFRYIDGIMLDGWKIDNVASLEDLRDEACPNVSVLVAVDGYNLDTNPAYASLVAVGAASGMFAVRQINENIGSVEVLNPPAAMRGFESYPLGNATRWLSAKLPNFDDISIYPEPVQRDMADKGYIFAGSFNGYEGFYLSGDPTCVDANSDYAYINNNCVWNAAARIVRNAMIPKIRSVLKKDPTTGFLRATTALALQDRAQKRLDVLVNRDLVSAVAVFLDPEQTPSATVPLVVNVQVVKDGILHAMDINLGLFNNISA
ncbi:MAG: DUF2586 family protein [Gammaproteobacteria bacterium]|nr:DUF2586 family protein [Gammaproteobacteria bacterium]